MFVASPFTPHARGSTHGVKVRSLSSVVYPACAGIDPSRVLQSDRIPFTRMLGIDLVSAAPLGGGGVYPACADNPLGRHSPSFNVYPA